MRGREERAGKQLEVSLEHPFKLRSVTLPRNEVQKERRPSSLQQKFSGSSKKKKKKIEKDWLAGVA